MALTVASLERRIDADVELPGSKSITNRALLAAALARGHSSLSRVLLADDTEAMLDCARALGAVVDHDPAAATAEIEGIDGALPPTGTAFARQSGTTARFVAPVVALARGPWRLDGDPQLAARPMGDLFSALRALGAVVGEAPAGRSLPVEISGPIVGRRASVSGEVSSQFLSGLLLAAPLAPEGLEITVEGALVSAPYVAMTAAVMRDFGAQVDAEGRRYRVAPGGYRGASLAIEPDASAASYFFAAAAIGGGRVAVDGLGSDSVQGDLAFVEVLAAMGAAVSSSPRATEVRGPRRLGGVSVDCGSFSDTVPTLAVVAAFAEGPTEIRGVGFIRAKESDRIGAVVSELGRCGVEVREDPDGLTVFPSAAHGALVRTHGDHRIAMAFSVLGLFVPGIEIDDPGCVAKTFPEFFAALDQLRS
ncbi:MAG TPA: 3-phosphoshikimate 1-carboxyvinyltransferase [Acidimicrobiales bacterium]|nr:3-phosphoshikimate 1-carboxyvinyltransferase [Acidimicrobiales bacterium]